MLRVSMLFKDVSHDKARKEKQQVATKALNKPYQHIPRQNTLIELPQTQTVNKEKPKIDSSQTAEEPYNSSLFMFGLDQGYKTTEKNGWLIEQMFSFFNLLDLRCVQIT
jgi:hypothetical protein